MNLQLNMTIPSFLNHFFFPLCEVLLCYQKKHEEKYSTYIRELLLLSKLVRFSSSLDSSCSSLSSVNLVFSLQDLTEMLDHKNSLNRISIPETQTSLEPKR